MKCKIFAFFMIMPVLPAFSDDCLSYKVNPQVEIIVPTWRKEVIQPLRPMDLLHGNVAATLVENYEIIGDTTYIEDGYCISLKSVSATIGYSDFLVKIDSRHKPETCSYDAVLSHEDEHIRVYLSVIDDYSSRIRTAVQTAVDSITPIFINDESDADKAMDMLHTKLQSHPEIVLIKQKIQAEQELRNKRVDQVETGAYMKQCL